MTTDPTAAADAPPDPDARRPGSPLAAGRAWAVGLAVAFVATLAPTLGWFEFHNPIENLNVATALEIRRGGPWLVPTLQGLPRIAKPPLTAWLTAASIRDETMAAVASPDAGTRAAGYRRLAFEARLPALIAFGLFIVATYELGRAAGGDGPRGRRVGLLAAAVCATCALVLRQCQLATTDAILAACVTIANALLARAILLGRCRWELPLAGLALGLALMSKGPVGLVQSVIPAALFAVFMIGREEPAPVAGVPARERRWLLPAAAGLVLMLVVGGAWYAAVVARDGRPVIDMWRAEVTRVDADDVPAGAWYSHAVSLWRLFPWAGWLLLGLFLAGRDVFARRATGGVYALVLLLVPLVVMSMAKDRYDRYLPPLMPAAAVLCALGLNLLWDVAARRSLAVRLLEIGQWVAAVAWAVGLPLAALAGPFLLSLGIDWLKVNVTLSGEPWFPWPVAATMALAVTAAVTVGVVVARRRPGVGVAVIAGLMLATQVAYTHGRGRSEDGTADLRPAAEALCASHPDAAVFALRSDKRNPINVPANELSIYLNRATGWAKDVAEMERHPGTVAWVATVRRSQPDRVMPPRWTVFARTDGADKKFVFVRPAPTKVPTSVPSTAPSVTPADPSPPAPAPRPSASRPAPGT